MRGKYYWLAGGWRLLLECCERKTLLTGWRLLEQNRVGPSPTCRRFPILFDHQNIGLQ